MGKPNNEQNKNIDRHIFKHIQFAEDSLPNKLEQKKKQKKSKKQKTKTSLFCVSTIYGVHSWSDQVKYNKAEVFCLKELRFRTM